MRHLNYSHLHYFWTVAREGSIAAAAEALHLTPQTVSSQLKLLQESIGQPLFTRAGRGLALTDTGRVVKEYADEIFTIGAELAHRVRTGEPAARTVLNVGIVNSIPKLVVCRVLAPAMTTAEPFRVVVRESSFEELLGDLAVHRIDLVLSDRAIPPGMNVKAYNHPLGESDIAFFAREADAAAYAKGFPKSLDDAPTLLPIASSASRRALDDWFERVGVSPRIVAECEDNALLKAFGEAGMGVFPAPMAIATEVSQMYDSQLVGQADGVREAYFAISAERKLTHPAIRRVTEAARSRLFRPVR
jgi:LysR family transcriptional activator of nhaA